MPPDTLGTQGVIRDVWVFGRNNAWAVGEIYLNDSTGKPDMANPYNAAHWDGSKWELKRIQSIICGSSTNIVSQLYTIFGFTSNDIWYSDGGEMIHWNGQTYNNDCSMNGILTGAIKKIYAVSPQDVYVVGNSGAIVHYNGSSWTKMTSNTTVDLQDIWGIDATHVWATGTNVGDGHSMVLQCNGASWTILYDSNLQLPQSKFGFGCLWTNTSQTIYSDGGSGLHLLNLTNFNISAQVNTGLSYVASSIRGINQNDIFDVTTGGEVAHYNGSSWYCYPEIQSLGGGNAGWGSVYPKNDFVVIGGSIFTGLNGFPVVIRGYR